MKLAELSPVPLPPADLTESIFVGENLLSSAPRIARELLGESCVLLADPDTLDACDASSWSMNKLILDRKPTADVETVQKVVSLLQPGQHLVALGSGTLNDIAKRTATMLDRPYVSIGTAASMNGYASGIAAILDNGLKTTVPARPPKAIILDTGVLARAPLALTRAGLGDLISKPVSDTDWWLADKVGESNYSELPSQIVNQAMEKATDAAASLKAGSQAAHGSLGEALILSGVAMVVAGSSSPASGGEHLISHLWDMENLYLDRPKHLHGAQVGVTTCLSAALYKMITQVQSPKWQAPITASEERRRLLRDHPFLVHTIERQCLAKHQNAYARVEQLRKNWSQIREGLIARRIPSPKSFRTILNSIDAPSHFEAFNLTRQEMRRTLAIAKDIRNRFTVLDLAADMGILPDYAERVLQAANM